MVHWHILSLVISIFGYTPKDFARAMGLDTSNRTKSESHQNVSGPFLGNFKVRQRGYENQ